MKLPGAPRAFVIFHPLQWPLARALLARYPEAELWYGRWDRYERAYDAAPRLRGRLDVLHEEAAERAALVFVASGALAEIEREAGREAELIGLAAGAFPAPDPERAVVAVSLGHLGHRVDWALLRAVAEGMPELVALLVGDVHPDELRDDADFAACRELGNLVFLGRRSDAEAARLILCADCGIVPFKIEPFNDAGLPYRILKAARLGRRSITPVLRGVLTWERAVVRADGAEAWIGALRAEAGRRCAPDHELRAGGLEQTAERVNEPLWAALGALGAAWEVESSPRRQSEQHGQRHPPARGRQAVRLPDRGRRPRPRRPLRDVRRPARAQRRREVDDDEGAHRAGHLRRGRD